MGQDNAELSPVGRTALGGAACGFTYDAALRDAVAREESLRRPLRLSRWQDAAGRAATPAPAARDRKLAEAGAGAGPNRRPA